MDHALVTRWKARQAPFHDVTLVVPDLVPLDELVAILTPIVAVCRQSAGQQVLYWQHDWHNHDGYVTTSKPYSWDELVNIVQSSERLYASRPGDTFVRIAVYPADFSFLLRVHVLEADEDPLYPGRWGECDISSDRALIDQISNRLMGSTWEVTIEPAGAYFDRGYAG